MAAKNAIDSAETKCCKDGSGRNIKATQTSNWANHARLMFYSFR